MPFQFYACKRTITTSEKRKHMPSYSVLKLIIPEINSEPYIIYILAATESQIRFRPCQLVAQT